VSSGCSIRRLDFFSRHQSGNGALVEYVFLASAAVLVWRFLRTGGPEMLRMMNRPMEAHHGHHA
jgi:hypothetical protein